MKKVLFFALIATLGVFTACEEETTESKKAPSVTAPAISNLEFGDTTWLSFPFTSEAGFKASSVTAVGGTATIKTDATVGSTSDTIVVTFIAGSSEGAGSVVLTITDADDQTGSATAVLSIAAEQKIFNVSANITANTTWKSGKVYILQSRITVVEGVTLTIEPGVVVKGEAGTGANATALLIARGAKIMAMGTETSPIIFTSVADEIMPGEVASPNLDPTVTGLWGGLIVLGKAPISASAAAKQIEGIPASDPNGLYGGDKEDDNSGMIKYISIRHGGANIGEGNEINGLTLGGVGSATVIENVEVVGNQDDGIEWFGGAVNVSNLLIWNSGDDAIDADQGWKGTLDNFIVLYPGDKGFELDGGEGSFNNICTIKNGTMRVGDISGGIADLDNTSDAAKLLTNSNVNMSNVYFFDIKAGQVFDTKPYEGTLTKLEATLDSLTIADYFKKGAELATTKVNLHANTVGADKSKFASWSWADKNGELKDLK